MSSPIDIDARLAVAQSLWERGEVVATEAILNELAARAPMREDVAGLLAKLLQSQGRLSAASDVMFGLCRAHGFAPAISERGARFIQQSHRQAVAADLCDRAMARGDAPPSLLAVAGNIARELGDFAKARALYLDALDRGVDLDTWYVLGALAHTKRYDDDRDPDLARLKAHFQNAIATPRASAASGFGLAKAFDDLGRYEAAAATLHEANARVRAVLPWSAASWRAFVDARMSDRVAAAASTAGDGFVPVFVVGLPRTGTTLTATRLAQGTVARDRGELRMLRFIAEELIGGGHLGDPAAIGEAADLYRRHARQDDAPATWYIDQDPMNFRYLDIVAAMFPRARIIWCTRGRRDTALSLWFQDFAHADAAFAFDFDGIARFAEGHDALMRHWQATLPLPIHVQEYEAFVERPEAALDALRAFVGAPPRDDATLQGSAPIHSASVWQARQPVYAGSVDRWRKYAPFVPELTQRFA